MHKKLFVLAVIVLITGCKREAGNSSGDCIDVLSKEQILNAANEAAQSSDLYIDGMAPYYDVDNEQWMNALSQGKKQDADGVKEWEGLIAGRCYQAVHYKAEKEMIDGAFWVLVDKETGEIIILIWGL